MERVEHISVDAAVPEEACRLILSGRIRIDPTEEESWKKDANCKTVKTSIFFPPKATPHTDRYRYYQRYIYPVIKAYCLACPVKDQCLSYGIATKSEGIFGGELLLGRGHNRGIIFRPDRNYRRNEPIKSTVSDESFLLSRYRNRDYHRKKSQERRDIKRENKDMPA